MLITRRKLIRTTLIAAPTVIGIRKAKAFDFCSTNCGTQPNVGLQFQFVNDVSWGSASAAAISAVASFASTMNGLCQVPFTVQYELGWGELANNPLSPPDALSANNYQLIGTSYSALRSAMIANATTTFAQNALAACVPASNPFPSGSFFCSVILAKALNLYARSPPGYDGGPDAQFSYNTGITYFYPPSPPGSGYDATGLAFNDATEPLGRNSSGGPTASGFFQPIDLFAWTAPGTRGFILNSNGSNIYLSFDGGSTNEAYFQANGTDLGNIIESSAFITGHSTGTTYALSTLDKKILSAIGWSGAY